MKKNCAPPSTCCFPHRRNSVLRAEDPVSRVRRTGRRRMQVSPAHGKSAETGAASSPDRAAQEALAPVAAADSRIKLRRIFVFRNSIEDALHMRLFAAALSVCLLAAKLTAAEPAPPLAVTATPAADEDFRGELKPTPALDLTAARNAIRLVDGFQVELVAAEPLVASPWR